MVPAKENKSRYFLMNLRFPKPNWTLIWVVRHLAAGRGHKAINRSG